MPHWFFGKSIKTQLIILLFALTAISVSVVGFVGIRAVVGSGDKTEKLISTSTQDRAEELLVQTAQATAEKNSLLFKGVQRDALIAAEYMRGAFEKPTNFPNSYWKYDGRVTRLATGQYTNSKDELSSVFVQSTLAITPQVKRTLELSSYLDFLIPQHLKDDPNAVAMYFISTEGITRYYPNIELASITDPTFDASTAEFFTVAAPAANPGKTTQWTTVYDDPAGNGLMITASHPIYTSGTTFVGVIGVDVTLNNIAKNIEDYSPIESSYAFLIDNQGRAVALPAQGYKDILNRSQKTDEFGSDLKDVQGDFAPILANMRSGKSGFSTAGTGDNALYVAYAPLEGTNFNLGIVAKGSSLLKVVADVRGQVKDTTRTVLYYQILPIAIVLLALVWVAGFLYIRMLTGPIIALTKQTINLRPGNFQPVMTDRASAEVGTLARAFNKMIGELSESYQALERKVQELGDAKAKDEAILTSIGDGMIVTDSGGKILFVNKAGAETFEIDEKTSAGNSPALLYQLYDEKDEPIPTEERPLHRALSSGKRVNAEVKTTRKNGTKSMLFVTATPVVQNGRIIGAIEIIRDVTKAKEVDRMKTEFISVASHQLRTPLSAIRWFSEMLMSDSDNLEAQQKEFISNISGSTTRMIELVNSLLNISRIESGRITVEPRPVDLKVLIPDIIKEQQVQATKRKQKLTVTVDAAVPSINLDPQLTTQIYTNLITNAIKYTPNNGTIEVDISLSGKEIVSRVTDNGYGIPQAEQAKIFNKFFRASNIIKVETDGTGLGLYLIKAIVEASGGRIWFESEESKGTTFWFTLPLSGMQAKDGEVTLG